MAAAGRSQGLGECSADRGAPAGAAQLRVRAAAGAGVTTEGGVVRRTPLPPPFRQPQRRREAAARWKQQRGRKRQPGPGLASGKRKGCGRAGSLEPQGAFQLGIRSTCDGRAWGLEGRRRDLKKRREQQQCQSICHDALIWFVCTGVSAARAFSSHAAELMLARRRS